MTDAADVDDLGNETTETRDVDAGEELGEQVSSARKRNQPLVVGLTLVAVGALAWVEPFMAGTIAALLAMITAHELGHLWMARRAGMETPEFSVGFGPTLWSTTRGETTWCVKAIPLGGYVRIVGMSDSEKVDPDLEQRTYRSKPWRWRVLVSAGGPLANLVLAFALVVVTLMAFGEARPDVSSRIGGVAETVGDAQSPAASVGLEPGDVIVSVGGVKVDTWEQFVDEVRSQPDERLSIVYMHDGEELTTEVTLANNEGRGVLGVSQGEDRVRLGPLQAVEGAASSVGRTAALTYKALFGIAGGIGDYFGQVTTGDQVQPEKRFLSPVGASRLAESTARNGIASLLGLAALVNIMLAAFNLLPIPPLDGGHILVASIEKALSLVRRREVRVPARVLMPVSFAMWGVLMLVGLSALWLDLVDPVKF